MVYLYNLENKKKFLFIGMDEDYIFLAEIDTGALIWENKDKFTEKYIFDDKRKSKTDLNFKQIVAINKIGTAGVLYGSGLPQFHTNDLMVLLLSNARKSRGEMVEGLRSKITDIVNKAKTGLLG